jgi:galactokinase
MPTAFAPGSVNLIGEHTDYSGGLVLPAAIQLGVTVEARGGGDRIALSSSLYEPSASFAADGSGPPPDGWSRFGHAVAAELAALGRPPVGMEAAVSSDLPAGAGLSSSAALEVSLALALCAVAEFEVEPMALALACQRAELRAVGVPCGILDQAAAILGRRDAAVLLDCGTLDHRVVPVPGSVAFLVVESGVERSLETTAYATRRAELEEALREVGVERSTQATADDAARLDGTAARRLRHVVTENERVLRFVDALGADDLDAAGSLLLASHASLRDDYEVSIPELDRIVEVAVDAGARGARLLGAGFGGAAIVLVDGDRAEEIAATIASAGGGHGEPLVVHPSDGAALRGSRDASPSRDGV